MAARSAAVRPRSRLSPIGNGSGSSAQGPVPRGRRGVLTTHPSLVLQVRHGVVGRPGPEAGWPAVRLPGRPRQHLCGAVRPWWMPGSASEGRTPERDGRLSHESSYGGGCTARGGFARRVSRSVPAWALSAAGSITHMGSGESGYRQAAVTRGHPPLVACRWLGIPPTAPRPKRRGPATAQGRRAAAFRAAVALLVPDPGPNCVRGHCCQLGDPSDWEFCIPSRTDQRAQLGVQFLQLGEEFDPSPAGAGEGPFCLGPELGRCRILHHADHSDACSIGCAILLCDLPEPRCAGARQPPPSSGRAGQGQAALYPPLGPHCRSAVPAGRMRRPGRREAEPCPSSPKRYGGRYWICGHPDRRRPDECGRSAGAGRAVPADAVSGAVVCGGASAAATAAATASADAAAIRSASRRASYAR